MTEDDVLLAPWAFNRTSLELKPETKENVSRLLTF